MPADNVEFSSDRRFRLYYWDNVVAGVPRTWIRLEHAPTSRTVLDLTDDGCTVDSHAFSSDGKLLYLRLSRADRSVVGYSATLDLTTGLYYHHPDPRQANGPAGHAEDLELIAGTGRPPPQHAPGDLIRWPTPQEIDWSEMPGSRVMNQPVDLTPAAPQPFHSSDGQWVIKFDLPKAGAPVSLLHFRVVHIASRRIVFDLRGTQWSCLGEFISGSNQIRMQIVDSTGAAWLQVRLDPEARLYWEEGGTTLGAPGGIAAGPLFELQERLTAEPDVFAAPKLPRRPDIPPDAIEEESPGDGKAAGQSGAAAQADDYKLPDVLSQDGLYRAEFFQFEMRMSHWVRTCAIRYLPTGAIVADFSRTLYDVTITFLTEPHIAILKLWKYPGDRPARSVRVNLRDGTYRDLDESGQPTSFPFPIANLTKSD